MEQNIKRNEKDIRSELRRTCPNCNRDFEIKHLSRFFCGDHCSDQYYNRNRRKNKTPPFVGAPNEIPQPEPINKVEIIPDAIQSNGFTRMSIGEYEEKLKKNIKILDSFYIKEGGEGRYLTDQLLNLGFEFQIYSDKGILHNTTESHTCCFFRYGSYRIYQIEYGILLIVKNKN